MKTKVIAAMALGIIMVLGTLAPAFAEKDREHLTSEGVQRMSYGFGYQGVFDYDDIMYLSCNMIPMLYDQTQDMFNQFLEDGEYAAAAMALGQLDAYQDIYTIRCN